MYKFMAMVWNENDNSAARTAEYIRNKIQTSNTSWEKAFESNRSIVLHTGEHRGRMQAIKLEKNGGVILGAIFKKTPNGYHSSVDNNISEDESQRVITTSGKHLVEYYWGRYIAFLNDNNTHTTSVVKGPVEGWRCYYINYQGVTLYFSFFEDIIRLDFLNFTINWHQIALHLKFGMLDYVDTAFNDIEKLQPGECRQNKRGDITSIVYWDPVEIASKAGIIEDPVEAAQLLRQTVVGSVSTWTKNYDKIIHKLSGGLDSSIVLSCLMESRDIKDVTCLNMYSLSDKCADERYFARLAAQHSGVQLIEKELDSSKVRLEQLFEISPLATPEWYLNAMDRCTYEAQLARDLGASVLFGGEGGDGIFFQPPTHFVTSDYLYIHGLTPALFWVALNNARMMKKSIWSVLHDAIKDRMIKSGGNDLFFGSEEESTLLNSEIMQNIEYKDILNSALGAENDLPYGKRLHIFLADMPNKYHQTAKVSDFLEVCYPLLSQPIIELCLRIPSYVLTTGGKDRGLARMAFKNDIPKEILRRESKGGIEIYIQEILDENIDFIKEILLDGILVKEKLVNREGLEMALTKTQMLVNCEKGNILRHVCTEVWLRKSIERKISIVA